MSKRLFSAVFLSMALACMAVQADAATKLTVTCSPPTTRIDGSVFSTADIGSYLATMTQPSTAASALGTQPACSYVVQIPVNTCIKAGTVFAVQISDKLGVWSDPGTYTLVADACNTLAKPSKPTVTVTAS